MPIRLPKTILAGGSAAMLLVGAAATAQANVEITEPSIIIRNQSLDNNQVTLDYAFLPQKGYAVVYKAGDERKPTGEPLGHVPLDAGDHRNVKIELSGDVAAGSELLVSLYQDAGKQEAFDRKSDQSFWQGSLPGTNVVTVE
jgi:hypothetical protein